MLKPRVAIRAAKRPRRSGMSGTAGRSEGSTESLAQTGEGAAAKSLQTDLAGILANRGVLASVVQEVEDKASTFKATKARRATTTKSTRQGNEQVAQYAWPPQSGRK